MESWMSLLFGKHLYLYKDDQEEIERREKIKVIFDKDISSSLISWTNKYLLNIF